MNIRIDLAALKRGHTEHGKICEIAGVGPIPVETATEYLGEAFLKLLIIDGRPLNASKGTPWRWRPPPDTF